MPNLFYYCMCTVYAHDYHWCFYFSNFTCDLKYLTQICMYIAESKLVKVIRQKLVAEVV